jgi:amino acid transporter
MRQSLTHEICSGANFIIGVISFWHEEYTSQRWQIFLLYLAFTLGAWALNQFLVRALPNVDRFAFWWSLTGIVVVIICCLATASPNYQPAEFVFTRWINQTGEPSAQLPIDES